MGIRQRVLIVDDDERLRDLVSSYLMQNGFYVEVAACGEDAFQSISTGAIDIIILDINLPGADGLSICQKLRRSGVSTPIIMLTARSEDSDRINGLEIGADDYLTKPFNPRELVARIRAVLRRYDSNDKTSHHTKSLIYRFSHYLLDTKKQVLFMNDELVHLSSGEYLLLEILLLNAGKALSRDQLVLSMTSREHQPDQRAIDMLISRLRKKIDRTDTEVSLIRTLRGVGYIFVADVTVAEGS